MDREGSSAAIDCIFKFHAKCVTDYLFVFNHGNEVVEEYAK